MATPLPLYASELPARKAADIAARSGLEGWSVLTSLWARTFVDASPALARRPELGRTVAKAMRSAFLCATGLASLDARADAHARALADLGDLPDDASDEWDHLINLIGMLSDYFEQRTLEACIERALTWTLDARITSLARSLGLRNAAESLRRLPSEPRWVQTVAWVEAL